MLRHRLLTLVVLLVLSLVPSFTRAASQTPSDAAGLLLKIDGLVLDPMRASISGARISVKEESGLTARSTVSDANGAFTIVVSPGRYIITVSADGFDAVEQTVVVAQAAGERMTFVLPVAGVTETVDVSTPASSYEWRTIRSGTRTPALLRDVPQSVAVVTKQLIQDQAMLSLADVVRYVPGITAHQGENNRDQVIIRGNNSSADFFLDGVRDDVQYYRDLYNLERVEALKGPNAMTFGRGGGGGVVNRVSKEAEFAPANDVTVLTGSFQRKRLTADLDQPLTRSVAFRVNGLYENSNSFRKSVNLERYGVNPTLTLLVGNRTRITAGYEHFHDARLADRGIPSFQGLPAEVDTSLYFGDPDQSRVRARADALSAAITRQSGAITIRNRTLVGNYDRGYQNFVPGAVTADKTQVALTAYNNATTRLNVFNQTDVIYAHATGPVRHTLLTGVEVGRQLTDNFRNTGYFNNGETSVSVPYTAPTVSLPVTFRQSATDADNHLRTRVAAVYGQDQIELSRFVQLLTGVRFDVFDLKYRNNRTGDQLGRVDDLVSPRVGLVVKPIVPLSLYGSYSVSHLPSSGDQFSSLTTITEQIKPERFNNYEMGAKWDVQPNLALTSAVYRLDRTNTRSTDPVDPTRIVQTGSQRTNGFELEMNGRLSGVWQIAGGYAYQNAFVTSATTTARAGAQVAQVPHHTLSLWNMYQLRPRVGAGLGLVHRSDMFAAIDNTVTLPGYTDVDAAVFASLTARLRAQANVENLFNRTYYVNADNNTNISPGSPRAIRVALVARF